MIRSRPIRMGFRYLIHRIQRLHPFEVEALVSNRCNLRCAYCLCPTRPVPEITTMQWKGIIRGFARLGTLRFKLHGGEPTLREDFSDLAAEVQSAGMISAAVTNGLIIASRPRLLDHLDELVVSFDSPQRAVNDRLRGKGSHEAAVQTMELSRRRGVRTIVNMVLTRENVQDLEAMLEFCEARGMRMNAQPIAFGGMYYDDRAGSLALTDGQIREVHRHLIQWKRQGRGLLFSTQAYQKVIDWPDYRVLSVPSDGVSSCVAGRDYIRLESNGDVLPCCQYAGNFVPKNILREGLEESLRHVQSHNCARCWLSYYNERNLLFKLRPLTILEALRRL